MSGKGVNADLLSHYAVSQKFPNPFNPTTQIIFTLKKSEHATVTVYNLLGQAVATLLEGSAADGQQYVLTFSAANLPKGVYFYTLRSGGLNDTKKMMLIK